MKYEDTAIGLEDLFTFIEHCQALELQETYLLQQIKEFAGGAGDPNLFHSLHKKRFSKKQWFE